MQFNDGGQSYSGAAAFKKGVHWDSSNFMIRINPPISYSRLYQLYPSGLSYDPYKWKFCINFQHVCVATYWANGSTSSKQIPIINTNWRYRFSLAANMKLLRHLTKVGRTAVSTILFFHWLNTQVTLKLKLENSYLQSTLITSYLHFLHKRKE